MVWTTFTVDELSAISRRLFMPLVLLITYTLMLYLIVFYWARRREHRVRLLFASGALGVVVLVPFATPDDYLVNRLNDVSESCSVLSFLLQITIIGRDLNKKIKFRTVLVFTYIAELLVAVDFVLIILSLICTMKNDLMSMFLQDLLPTINQTVTLGYVFFFRYYYIIASNGWRYVLANRKVEAMCYLLFATHMLPWYILSYVSGLPWDPVQALWHRITLAGSLWMTAHGKLRSSASSRTTARVTNVPAQGASGTSAGRTTGSTPMQQPAEADIVMALNPGSYRVENLSDSRARSTRAKSVTPGPSIRSNRWSGRENVRGQR